MTVHRRIPGSGPCDMNAGGRFTLTDEERRILLAELAEITAELDELLSRAEEIAQRVTAAETSAQGVPWEGAA